MFELGLAGCVEWWSDWGLEFGHCEMRCGVLEGFVMDVLGAM